VGDPDRPDVSGGALEGVEDHPQFGEILRTPRKNQTLAESFDVHEKGPQNLLILYNRPAASPKPRLRLEAVQGKGLQKIGRREGGQVVVVDEKGTGNDRGKGRRVFPLPLTAGAPGKRPCLRPGLRTLPDGAARADPGAVLDGAGNAALRGGGDFTAPADFLDRAAPVDFQDFSVFPGFLVFPDFPVFLDFFVFLDF
jgi:hypothetical protein